ncbi:Cytochrome-cbb3 oxidase, subunit III [gamma proteobacterium HdN1]|nr:Cytochrome-cbb3 oxidase, subunit III [gamma proteobacterium HdN1]
MSNFWSGWVMALVVINYGVILLLFLWAPTADIPVEKDGTTGHSWANGTIREGLARLPKWWLVISTAGFIAAFIYLVRYPGFGSNAGTLDWTSNEQLDGEVAVHNQSMAALRNEIEQGSVLALGYNKESMQLGERLFEDNCAACHSYDAKGNHFVGAPNLTDNTWLYGGKVADIINSITNGRNGTMPAWQDALGAEKVSQVAQYVRSLSGLPSESALVAAGKEVFSTTCAACHGADGKGNHMLGAADLTDHDWLYGDSLEAVTATIAHGRSGHMPAWKTRLNDSQIKVLAAWVLNHGNSEEAVAAGDK